MTREQNHSGSRNLSSVLSSLLPRKDLLIPVPPTAAHPIGAGAAQVTVAGDNSGQILNLNAAHVHIVEQQVALQLPSFLSRVIVQLSNDWSEYNSGPHRPLPPEVGIKLAYNDFPARHHLIADYTRYAGLLELAYRGVEQRNDDARRMVRRRAAVAYSKVLNDLCTANDVAHSNAHALVRKNAVNLVCSVIEKLLSEFAAGESGGIMHELAHLAISLIVADAVIECDVLERPTDAAAS